MYIRRCTLLTTMTWQVSRFLMCSYKNSHSGFMQSSLKVNVKNLSGKPGHCVVAGVLHSHILHVPPFNGAFLSLGISLWVASLVQTPTHCYNRKPWWIEVIHINQQFTLQSLLLCELQESPCDWWFIPCCLSLVCKTFLCTPQLVGTLLWRRIGFTLPCYCSLSLRQTARTWLTVDCSQDTLVSQSVDGVLPVLS